MYCIVRFINFKIDVHIVYDNLILGARSSVFNSFIITLNPEHWQQTLLPMFQLDGISKLGNVQVPCDVFF